PQGARGDVRPETDWGRRGRTNVAAAMDGNGSPNAARRFHSDDRVGRVSHPPHRPANDRRISPGESSRSLHHVDRVDPGGAAGAARGASPDDRRPTAGNPAATCNTWRRSSPMMTPVPSIRIVFTLGAVAIASATSPLLRSALAQTSAGVDRRDSLLASATPRDTIKVGALPEDEITTATRDFLATGVARVVRQGSF